MHERMLFLLAHFTGSVVQVTTKNGVKYEGVFHGASTESGDIGVVLKYPQKIHDIEHNDHPKKINKQPLLILGKDLVEISCADTDLTVGEGAANDHKDSFKTDSDISGRMEIKERELHKWNPETLEGEGEFGALEGEDPVRGSEGSTSNGGGVAGGTWDQFAANEKLFGVKTDFDEEIYTTHLDRSAPDFKDRERWAIEKANEIQRSGAINTHVLEERGVVVDDLDEEDRYGAVIRDPSKYTPPALRKRQPSPRKEHSPPEKPDLSNKNSSLLHKLMTGTLPKADGAAPSPIANLPTIRATDGGGAASASSIASAVTAASNNSNSANNKFAIQEKGKLFAKKQALQKKDKEDRVAALMQFHKSFKLTSPCPDDLMPLLSKNRKTTSNAASTKPVPSSVAAEPASTSTVVSAKTTNHSSPAGSGSPTATATQEKKSENDNQLSTAEKTKQATGPTEEKKTQLPATATTTTTTTTTTTSSSSITSTTSVPASPTPEEKDTVTSNGSKTTPTASAATASETKSLKTSFKFNVKATEFRPNPSAAIFIPGAKRGSSSGEGSPFFAGRQLKRSTDIEPLTLAEAFKPPFSKDKEPVTPSSVGPTWPFGTKQYKLQFNPYSPYEDDMYSYTQPGFPYGFPQYRFQPFVHNIPIGAAPMPPPGGAPPPPGVAYSPQMANVSPHGSPFPQGFPSPQRSPIPPHGVPPHQIYQYQVPRLEARQ
ncbi:hypothetical protein BX666DRAFT_1873850 [Dichotomocladium elegans]|nr:hypothetical protein BX666DRAFT_1873850 [Dichotomocladium elegans]